MFRKLVEPCGLHCIRMTDIGVTVGEQEILKNINLHIHCGTLAAVIGKNGAGKSTVMNIICGIVRQSDGKVSVAGIDVLKHPLEAKAHIGFLPQNPPIYADFTVELCGCRKGRTNHLSGSLELSWH